MKNADVINAWNLGQTAQSHTGSLRTDGDKIWSYSLVVGRSDGDGNKVIFDFTSGGGCFASQTTSVHVNKIKQLTPKGSCTIMRPEVAKIAGLI